MGIVKWRLKTSTFLWKHQVENRLSPYVKSIVLRFVLDYIAPENCFYIKKYGKKCLIGGAIWCIIIRKCLLVNHLFDGEDEEETFSVQLQIEMYPIRKSMSFEAVNICKRSKSYYL